MIARSSSIPSTRLCISPPRNCPLTGSTTSLSRPPLRPPTPPMPSYTAIFFNDTATTEIYTLSLHDALPISWQPRLAHRLGGPRRSRGAARARRGDGHARLRPGRQAARLCLPGRLLRGVPAGRSGAAPDRARASGRARLRRALRGAVGAAAPRRVGEHHADQRRHPARLPLARDGQALAHAGAGGAAAGLDPALGVAAIDAALEPPGPPRGVRGQDVRRL